MHKKRLGNPRQRSLLLKWEASHGDIKAMKRLGVDPASVKKAEEKKKKQEKRKILEAKRALAIQYGWLEPKQIVVALPATRSDKFYGTSKPKDVKKMVIAVQGRKEMPAVDLASFSSLQGDAQAIRAAAATYEGRKLLDQLVLAQRQGKLDQRIKELRLALENAGLGSMVAGVNTRAGQYKPPRKRRSNKKSSPAKQVGVRTGCDLPVLVTPETVFFSGLRLAARTASKVTPSKVETAKVAARPKKQATKVNLEEVARIKKEKHLRRVEKMRERKAARLTEYLAGRKASVTKVTKKFLSGVDAVLVCFIKVFFKGVAIGLAMLLSFAAASFFIALAVSAEHKEVRKFSKNKRRGGGVPPTSETCLRTFRRPWQIRLWLKHRNCIKKQGFLSRVASACKKLVRLFRGKKKVSKRRIDLQFFAEKPDKKITIETVSGVEVVKTSFVKDTVEHSVVIPRTKESLQGISTESLLKLGFVPYDPSKVTKQTKWFLGRLGTDLLALQGEGNLTVYVPYDPKAPKTDIHCEKGPKEVKYFCGFEQQIPADNSQDVKYKLSMGELLEYKRIATAMKNEIGLATTAAVQMVSTLLVELPKKEKVPMDIILSLMRILELWELQPLQDKSAPQTLFTTSLAKELLNVPERPESLAEAIAEKQKKGKQQKSEPESRTEGYKKSEKEKQKAFCNSVIKVLKASNASDEPVSFTAIRLLLSVLVDGEPLYKRMLVPHHDALDPSWDELCENEPYGTLTKEKASEKYNTYLKGLEIKKVLKAQEELGVDDQDLLQSYEDLFSEIQGDLLSEDKLEEYEDLVDDSSDIGDAASPDEDEEITEVENKNYVTLNTYAVIVDYDKDGNLVKKFCPRSVHTVDMADGSTRQLIVPNEIRVGNELLRLLGWGRQVDEDGNTVFKIPPKNEFFKEGLNLNRLTDLRVFRYLPFKYVRLIDLVAKDDAPIPELDDLLAYQKWFDKLENLDGPGSFLALSAEACEAKIKEAQEKGLATENPFRLTNHVDINDARFSFAPSSKNDYGKTALYALYDLKTGTYDERTCEFERLLRPFRYMSEAKRQISSSVMQSLRLYCTDKKGNQTSMPVGIKDEENTLMTIGGRQELMFGNLLIGAIVRNYHYWHLNTVGEATLMAEALRRELTCYIDEYDVAKGHFGFCGNKSLFAAYAGNLSAKIKEGQFAGEVLPIHYVQGGNKRKNQNEMIFTGTIRVNNLLANRKRIALTASGNNEKVQPEYKAVIADLVKPDGKVVYENATIIVEKVGFDLLMNRGPKVTKANFLSKQQKIFSLHVGNTNFFDGYKKPEKEVVKTQLLEEAGAVINKVKESALALQKKGLLQEKIYGEDFFPSLPGVVKDVSNMYLISPADYKEVINIFSSPIRLFGEEILLPGNIVYIPKKGIMYNEFWKAVSKAKSEVSLGRMSDKAFIALLNRLDGILKKQHKASLVTKRRVVRSTITAVLSKRPMGVSVNLKTLKAVIRLVENPVFRARLLRELKDQDTYQFLKKNKIYVFVDGSPDYGHSQDARIVACREDIAGIGLGQKLIKLLGRDCDGDYIRIGLVEEKTKWANPVTESEIEEAEKKRAEKIEASLKEQGDFLAPKEEKSSEEQTATPEGDAAQVTTTECAVPTENDPADKAVSTTADTASKYVESKRHNICRVAFTDTGYKCIFGNSVNVNEVVEKLENESDFDWKVRMLYKVLAHETQSASTYKVDEVFLKELNAAIRALDDKTSALTSADLNIKAVLKVYRGKCCEVLGVDKKALPAVKKSKKVAQAVAAEGNTTQVTATECAVPAETQMPSEGTEVNNVVDVKEFRGKYAFLSNMYRCQVKVDGIVYQSAEAAYQAQKTTDIDIRHEFSKLGPVEAKEKGRHIQMLRSFNRIDAMGKVLIAKFSQNKDLLDELLKINGVIVEGNTWNDTFWGVCNGKGENMLGKMLSRIRDNVLAKTKSVPPAAQENK